VGNLNEKQVEFARSIHSAGSDLLNLINDILDLSKIESGTVTVEAEELTFASLRESVERNFRHIAENKNLPFNIEFDPSLPSNFTTDSKRLQQIIKNLLSNAFKFTASGGVKLKIERVASGWNQVADHVLNSGQALAFSVQDSGIGIPEDKQRIIFEAFQQADGTTSRKYGGTGLGLSISREITRTLGGELRVESEPDKGSTFTLYLPLHFSPAAAPAAGGPATPSVIVRTQPVEQEDQAIETVSDDRDEIVAGDRVILIVEDDPRFSAILLALVRDCGFKAVITSEGVAAASLARRFGPQAILLDIGLPDMDGLALLDLLKRTPETRHIPVHVISADDQAGLGLAIGAFGFTPKPIQREDVVASLDEVSAFVTTENRRLVYVGPTGAAATALRSAFGSVTRVEGLKGLAKAKVRSADSLIIDTASATPPQIAEHLRTMDRAVVVYADRPLEPEDERRLRLSVFSGRARLARTPEQLVEQAALLMHEPTHKLSESARSALARNRREDAILTGRKALVIDDDIRNIFSMASALEEFGVGLHYAESGRAGLELLRQHPDVDIVLVDIMMPDMDGYETMREIRAMAGFADLPIIAVTAKAMKGDRSKCIEAGASDYVSKPVDIDYLISVMRVSIQRADAHRLAAREPAAV
jgi:CheY-like chemotaxis protein/two-component sensor histidine kinase